MSKGMTVGDVDNLPGALTIDPCLPRLIGCGPERLSFTQYNNWRLRSGQNWVIVEPRVASSREWAWFLGILALLAAAAEYAAWHFATPGMSRFLWMIGTQVPFVALLSAVTVIQWIGKSASAKGAIVSYSADDGILHIPSLGRDIPRSQLIRLDLISGTWVRDLYSTGEHPFEIGTELHVVVRLKSGRVVSLPLLGTQGSVISLNRGLGQVAHVLSKFSGIDLERIEERTGFRDPYAKVRRQIEQCGCTACGYDLTGNTSGVCPECGTPIPPLPEAGI